MNEDPNIFVNDNVAIGQTLGIQKFQEVCPQRMSAKKFSNPFNESKIVKNEKKEINKSFMSKLKNIIKETKKMSNEVSNKDKGYSTLELFIKGLKNEKDKNDSDDI